MRRKKKITVTAETIGLDTAVGESRLTSAMMDTVIESPLREDSTVPNIEVSAILAAQDQFEAVKRGEANISVEATIRALNQVSPELDWSAIETKIRENVRGDIQIIDEKIVVTGATQDEAKGLSAKIWKVLADLKKSQQIRSLPIVEIKVKDRS